MTQLDEPRHLPSSGGKVLQNIVKTSSMCWVGRVTFIILSHNKLVIEENDSELHYLDQGALALQETEEVPVC